MLTVNNSKRSEALYNINASDYEIRSARYNLYTHFSNTDLKTGITFDDPKETANEFCKELFGILYDESEISKTGLTWAKAAMEQVCKTADFKKLADKCYLNHRLSLQATSILIDRMASQVSELRKEQNKSSQKDLDEFGVVFDDSYLPDSDDIETLSDRLKSIPKEILKEFQDGEIIEGMIGACPGNGTDDLGSGNSFGRRLLNDVKKNPALRKIFLKAGSLLDAMTSKTVKEQSTIENIVGIGQGRNLSMLTNASRSLLMNPVTETLFYDKFCRNLLDVFEYEADVEKGRGPIWIMLDRSSSTRRNERYIIMSAIAIAFIHLAKKEKRPIWIIEFNGALKYEQSMDSEGNCFLYESPADFTHLVAGVAKRSPSGGTDFDKPITRCLNTDPNAVKADMIMVTDGCASLAPEVESRVNDFKEKGMKFYTILLGVRAKYLEGVSDEIVDLEKLDSESADSAIGSIMNSVSTS